MNFIKKWNRFWFTQSMNSFDMLCILSVAALARDSWWWILMLLPLNMLSVYMEHVVKDQS